MHTADGCFVRTTQQTLAMRLCLIHNQTTVIYFVIHPSWCASTPKDCIVECTPIVVSHETGCCFNQRAARWAMRFASYTIKLFLFWSFIHLFVCINTRFCVVGCRTPIVNQEEGCRLSQKATLWAMRLCSVHDQTTAVWAFWCYVCVCVRGLGLMCVYMRYCQTNNFRLLFTHIGISGWVSWEDPFRKKIYNLILFKRCRSNTHISITLIHILIPTWP